MKKIFSGYYTPSEDEFKTLWDDCIFTFDTNILLNLYRYSRETSAEIIRVLEKQIPRLWISHQTGYEFHKKRIGIREQQINAYEGIQLKIEKLIDEIKDKLDSKSHPFFEKSDEFIEKVKDIFKPIETELNNQKKGYLEFLNPDGIKDNILDQIANLFEDRTGKSYSNERLDKIFIEGKKRYDKKIPPGFSDASKDDEYKKYGDLVIWFQIIDKAKDSKKPIIFVTEDGKPDWWWQRDGKVLGPRPELIQELRAEADVQFFMYSLDPFLEAMKKYLDVKVKEEAIKEAKTLRRLDQEAFKAATELFGTLRAAQIAQPFGSIDTDAIRRVAQIAQPFGSIDTDAIRRAAQIAQPFGSIDTDAIRRVAQIAHPFNLTTYDILVRAAQEQIDHKSKEVDEGEKNTNDEELNSNDTSPDSSTTEESGETEQSNDEPPKE